MFCQSSLLTFRHRFALLLLLALLTNMFPTPPYLASASPKNVKSSRSAADAARASSATQPMLPPQAPVQSFVRVVNLPTNDIVFNEQTQKIHASVPSSAGSTGNSITEINPVDGAVGQSVFVGSEPNKLALSTDGQILYASLDGAAAVRRFDVPTHTAGLQFSLGTEQFFGNPFLAADMAVAPGNSNLLAVSRTRPGVSPPGAGVAIFDNGAQRSTTTNGNGDSNVFLSFSASDSTLYGSVSFGGLQTLSIDSSGVTLASTTPFSVGGDIQFQNGLVYSSLGKVVNPSTNTLVGTFAGVGSGPFVVDSTVGRAYYIIGNSTNLDQTVTLRAFDINTFLSLGEITISDVDGAATSLVRWGPNGLAFRTAGNQLFLIQTSLIPSATPVPSPTPTPIATPTPTPTPVELSVRQIQLNTKDLIYNSSNQTIYSSVPSSAGSTGNSIALINPTTGAVAAPVFVGSEPNKLALSDDGQSLYVGLDGAASVRRFDIASQTAGSQFFLGSVQFSGPFLASDIAVMPGSPSTVAVARGGGFDASIAIYENGVRRTNTSNGAGNDIEFGASPTRLYSSGTGFGSGILRHVVNGSGVTFESTAQGGNGGKMVFANGLIYTANGSVIDPEPGVLKGTFTGTGLSFNSIMAVDVALGRAYFLSIPSGLTALLRVYDINTFLPLGQVTIPNIGFTQNPDGFQFSSLVRWGENGLAFRTTTHVMLIQSSLVNPNGTVPTPTPVPSPTPTPNPTPEDATFIRQVDLQVNDFALSTSTQKLYASVPSSVGPGGNSIVEVDPATGVAGQPVFIGSEPTKLAISDNGQVLWASLEGAQAIRRFDIATKTPGQQFAITNIRPTDMEVMPGSPQTLAITAGGVPLVYDDGIQRPNPPTNSIRAGQIEFSANPSVLYGFNNGDTGFDFYRMTVSASGVALASSAQGLVGGGFSGNIKYVNGRVYSPSGQVFDPDTFIPFGAFRGLGAFFNALAIDTVLRRAFFLTEGSTSMVLRAYDIDTFLPVGQVTLPVGGSPGKMVRWGANGLAVQVSTNSNERRLFLIQSALVSTAAPIPTGVQFGAASTFTSEFVGRVDVQVIRTGDLSGLSSINYATSDGTANERSDYTTALGTLRFAPGESSKTFTVFITNDVLQEGAETINLTLSNPAGTLLVSPDKLLLTIQDDDFSPPTANPVDATSFFVRQHYRDFLNRDPDAAGLQFWSNEINSCGNDLQCREIKRINVSAAFFLSIEFQETGYLAYRMYKTAYGDTTSPNVTISVPIIRLREFLADAQRLGQGVQVGVGNWQAQLETNKTEYAREFVLTPRFLAAYPSALTPAQFVQKLDQNAGGVLSDTERDQLIAELSAATDVAQARASVTRKVAEDADLRQRENNRAFVLMQFYGYLRRNPDDPQDTDFRGWEFWVNKLNQFNGNFVDAEMVKAFIVATEYRQRFGP
jgi:sugar lactone lactonase YvrE